VPCLIRGGFGERCLIRVEPLHHQSVRLVDTSFSKIANVADLELRS